MTKDWHPMTGEEYRELRLSVGLSQVELAKKLRVTEQTVKNREAERCPIDYEAEMALRVTVNASRWG